MENKQVDIAEKYQWVVDRLHEAFPEANVLSEVREWGLGFAVGVDFSALNKTWAWIVQETKRAGGVMQWVPIDPEEDCYTEVEWKLGPPFQREIIGLCNEPDPQAKLEVWIDTIRSRLALEFLENA